MQNKISDAVIRRLPRYYRQLKALESVGKEKISSLALSTLMNVTASQIRQDLNCFGGFGQQGYGYNVRELRRKIAQILGIDRKYTLIIIGAGNIGQALASYGQFVSEGYEILALFDTSEALVGCEVGGVQVLHADMLDSFVQANPVEIAVIATPESVALAVAQKLVQLNIKAIWNFAPVELVLSGVVVENAQLTDGLMALTYRLGELHKGV
jgi:redox-sensing transcriptional repressor